MSELFDIHSHAGEQAHNLYNEEDEFPRKQTVEKLIEMYGDRIDKIVTIPMPGTVFLNYDEGDIPRNSESGGRYPYDLENHALLEAVGRFDSEERILPFACIHPTKMVTEQLAGLDSAMDRNRLMGIKFHTLDTDCDLSDFFGSSEITNFCREKDLPIMIHSANFDSVENCNDIFRWARLNPELRVCVAHLMNFSREFFDQLSQSAPDNVFTDVSPFLGLCKMAKHYEGKMDNLDLPFDDPASVMLTLCKKFGNHVLWGSDEPFGKFKLSDDEYVEYSLEDELRLLFSLDQKTRDQIASTNSKRFIGSKE